MSLLRQYLVILLALLLAAVSWAAPASDLWVCLDAGGGVDLHSSNAHDCAGTTRDYAPADMPVNDGCVDFLVHGSTARPATSVHAPVAKAVPLVGPATCNWLVAGPAPLAPLGVPQRASDDWLLTLIKTTVLRL